MKESITLSPANKLTLAGLIIAAAGVIIQIVSGVPYPKVPPVFFILLIPAGLVIFGRWRWTSTIVIMAGLFLTTGLFTSGAYVRLFNMSNFGGSAGLWVQMLGVFVATVAGFVITIQNFSTKAA